MDLKGRFVYHKVSVSENNQMADIRKKCEELAELIDNNSVDSREKSLSITHLEEVMFWANAGISRYSTEDNE